MTSERFNEIVREQVDTCMSLLGVKGDEYDTNSNDRLHAFKAAAEIQYVTPKQALAGMMAKHTISIYDMLANADEKPPVEKWVEKISDSINYLLLLRAIIQEEIDNNEA